MQFCPPCQSPNLYIWKGDLSPTNPCMLACWGHFQCNGNFSINRLIRIPSISNSSGCIFGYLLTKLQQFRRSRLLGLAVDPCVPCFHFDPNPPDLPLETSSLSWGSFQKAFIYCPFLYWNVLDQMC